MATAQVGYNPGQESASVTASPNLQTVQARYDPNAGVNSLIQALGADSTQRNLAAGIDSVMRERTAEQTAKIESYTEQIKGSMGDGARSVSAAQIKAVSPELVPTIRFAIAEKIGKMQGTKDTQALVAKIDADASFLDTDKRNAFIAEQRNKLISEIPDGNDFFKAGVVQGIDAQFAQNQQRWQAKTDQYHVKVETDFLSGEVVTALNAGGDVKAALTAADQSRKGNSSLNDLQSKSTIVGAVIDTAMTQKNPDLLNQIPDSLLNADLKVKVMQARTQILERSMSDERAARASRDDKRAEDDRVAYQAINKAQADGQRVNPSDYLNLSPAVYNYALTSQDKSTLPAATSAANAAIITEGILSEATTGTGSSLVELTQKIQGNSNLNSTDQVKLLNNLKGLVEGRDILSDPRLRKELADRIAPALADLSSSVNAKINKIDGVSLRGEVMRTINSNIKYSYIRSYETNKVWPTGDVAEALIQKAVSSGEVLIANRMKIASADTGTQAAPKPPVRGGPTPRTPSAIPSASRAAPAPTNDLAAQAAAELARRNQ